ncbi:helix-turn-helix domain-containing protein [Streptomyces sp. NPDC058612]|uniref:helix-turn-helix domain-containing protein n=1 Tax=Streptomyces sp. NPDC058612 TaxID=3346555 RepID=UPI00365D0241
MTTSRTMPRLSARETAQNALPAPGERRRLRELWGLTPQQVAVAFGVRAATVRSWESGRSEPTGQRRDAYRRFLQGLAQRANLGPRPAAPPAASLPAAAPPAAAPPAAAPPAVARPAAVLPASRSPRSDVPPRPGSPAAGAPASAPAQGAADRMPPVAGGTPACGWLPRVGAVAATLAGWVLVLVLLDAYLPGAAG